MGRGLPEAWPVGVGGAYPDDAVGAVATADAVQPLQEADEAVQHDPVPSAAPHPLPVHVPVAIAVGNAARPARRQQQEARPPELQGVDEAGRRHRGRLPGVLFTHSDNKAIGLSVQ